MKIKLLLLVGIGFAPFVLVAQTAFLYNKGVMSVKSTNVNNTTLYINGNFIAGHDATAACNITLDNSQTVLTGDFIHDLNGGTPANTTVFNYTASDASRFVFRGTAAQTIKLATGLTYGANYSQYLKGQNNIKFPTLVVQNSNHVTLVPELAAQAAGLSLETGRLILESRRAIATDFTGVAPGSTIHSTANSTMLAHFMVGSKGVATPNNNPTFAGTATSNNQFGAVQVNLQLDNPIDYTNGTRDERYGRSLIGMGSPYKEMKSDYFFWNFLMIPKNESIIGGTPGNTMTDPQRTLKAGEGFVIGIDLRGTNPANYEYDLHPIYKAVTPAEQPLFSARVTEKYQFSRFGPFFNNRNNVRQANAWGGHSAVTSSVMAAPNGVNGINDASYANEVLNYGDITGLTISQGYNYYANPYTVPLDLSPIVFGGTLPAWGSNGGIIVADANTTPRDFTNKVWILDPSSVGSGSYDILSPGGIGPGNKWVMVNAKYRVMKAVASTVNPYDPGNGDPKNFILAPLQMFVLYSPNGGVGGKTLTIPASARAITQNALFLRSASTSNQLIDDFIFEVKDEKIKTSDRTAIAIRTPQDVMTNADYEGTKKLVTLISSDQTTTRSTTEEGAVTQTNMSTVYTKSDAGIALESNILGVPQSAQSETVTLYVTPSLTAQNISITAGRLETAYRVKGIMLKDKVKNNEFDLFTGKTYTIESKATDPVDRFSLRFIFDTSGIEDGDNGSESKSITSYYLNGTLTVTGFDDADFGSVISVYDIQGRMAAQAKVNDTTVEITQPFSPGAYIVKVVGNKSYAAKFLVK
ncbi:T9SS type A sorting domain-containing protein [Dysgonomonas sp. HDW5B]|uniref:T9SS type A sorting domain-containing protein n=1 Tax=Dysgonomonas sp. HDW5B TaxID=2714927 RepID=UPI00140A1972|nr:T9SS type A sorting domain-containing protein [Dysgonomonas sp. HDW5B]QIK54821.1 T9SS type A sorting domain-containing protein [Dysgonomonas sp. HDW5B]